MTNDRNFDARSGFVDVCPTVTFGGQTIAHQEHHGKAFHHLRLRLYRGTWRTLDLSWIEKDTTSACAGKIRLRVRRSFLTPSLLNLRNIIDDLHTPNACRHFPICQSRARTTVSPSKLTAKLGVMSSRPAFQQACLRYIFCHFRAVTGKETRDINNMQ